MDAPNFDKTIPSQIINERAGFLPLSFRAFLAPYDGILEIRFTAELSHGEPLPKGLICTGDGFLTGIPAKDTAGQYEIKLTAENAAGISTTSFNLTINPSLSARYEKADEHKAQVWEAIKKNELTPELMEAMTRDITEQEIYYLLERLGTIKVWDAFNLESPTEKVLLNLKDASKHYNVYDRGSCLIATPKDLFSYERTLADGLQTAKALAREVHHRHWTVELVGLAKFTRAMWIELQRLGTLQGQPVEVVNYEPSMEDAKLVSLQDVSFVRGRQPE